MTNLEKLYKLRRLTGLDGSETTLIVRFLAYGIQDDRDQRTLEAIWIKHCAEPREAGKDKEKTLRHGSANRVWNRPSQPKL
jgi:hypothetical protein